MNVVFIFLAVAGGAVALVNFNEIIRDPGTKGWGVGFGLLVCVCFGSLAIWAA